MILLVKLQKRFAYEYKEKKHFKHVVIISDSIIDELGWKSGVELEQLVENGRLILKPQKKVEKEVRYET